VKTIDLGAASGTLTEYVEQAKTEPVVFTDQGTPTAVILTLANTDLETVSLGTNPEFIALIERSRARASAEGGLSAAETRRRVLPPVKQHFR
jgi:PHD/YefM family antitoxin component YafN of YafNO toxin-antitoxin module